MILSSLVFFMILAIVILAFITLIMQSLRFIFYSLLVVLALVFLFGVSYTQLLDWAAGILLWVL